MRPMDPNELPQDLDKCLVCHGPAGSTELVCPACVAQGHSEKSVLRQALGTTSANDGKKLGGW